MLWKIIDNLLKIQRFHRKYASVHKINCASCKKKIGIIQYTVVYLCSNQIAIHAADDKDDVYGR